MSNQRSHVDARSAPDFIGIGAARSGTTWISSSLGKSDEVWLPRRKELHYFSRGERYPSPSFLTDQNALARLLRMDSVGKAYRHVVYRALGSNILNPSLEQLRWDRKYFFDRPGDAWYRSLFAAHDDVITGEITPAYALLDDADVERVTSEFPDTRFVAILRNPIDRAWSTISYHEKRQRGASTQASLDELMAYVRQPGIEDRSDYAAMVRRWQNFAGDRFLLTYFDEISDHPHELLERVLTFIGVKDVETPLSRLSTKPVNTSTGATMPEGLRPMLAEHYRSRMEEFANLVGTYPARWLDVEPTNDATPSGVDNDDASPQASRASNGN